jgi:hypothetical protein
VRDNESTAALDPNTAQDVQGFVTDAIAAWDDDPRTGTYGPSSQTEPASSAVTNFPAGYSGGLVRAFPLAKNGLVGTTVGS